MDLVLIKQIASNLMQKRKVHLEREVGGAFYHGERVANTTLILRKNILPNDSSYDDILTVASWFHDVGKGIEPHNEFGATITKEALKNHCQENELEKITELINFHAKRCPQNNNYSDWIKIIQDSDLIDHFGTFTIWMDFFYSSYKEKSIKETTNYNEIEWNNHCQSNRDLLNYEVSKSIFDEKINFVNQFYERFKVEGTGGIFDFNNKDLK